jgi:hypothetical protein
MRTLLLNVYGIPWLSNILTYLEVISHFIHILFVRS